MTYKLVFNESAMKEWKKLGHTVQEQFKKSSGSVWKTPGFRHLSSMDVRISIILSYAEPDIALSIGSRTTLLPSLSLVWANAKTKTFIMLSGIATDVGLRDLFLLRIRTRFLSG